MTVTTRGTFLRKVAAAGVAGGGVAAFPGGALAALATTAPATEVSALNYLLELEHMQVDFWAQALKEANLGPEAKQFATVAQTQDRAHVRRLSRHLGASAIKKPTFTYTDSTRNEAIFQSRAGDFLNIVVRAYLGQLPTIETPAGSALAASMLAVEARHDAWIRTVAKGRGNDSPSPNAFASPLTRAQADAALKRIKIQKL